MSMGIRIKQARLAKNMTQDELAKRMGVSKNAISNYENGVSTPKIELLFPLMAALDVDANYLYGVDAEKNKSMPLTKHEQQLVIAYRSHPDMQEAVDRLLQLPAELEAKHKKA